MKKAASIKSHHVLLPKQVTPYRIDFPNLSLKNVKNVRMDVKSALVPASADPVIGVMNQKIDTDDRGKSVLSGDSVQSERRNGQHSACDRQFLR